jgi:hypothetical protein
MLPAVGHMGFETTTKWAHSKLHVMQHCAAITHPNVSILKKQVQGNRCLRRMYIELTRPSV